MSIRFMIIDGQAEFRSLLMHHISTHWNDAIISEYDPVASGYLPDEFTGRSLRTVAIGQNLSYWRDHIVVQNDMSQAGTVGDFRPRMQGRMVRTDRYKYCVYEFGKQRESLVDMQDDPLEAKNLASEAKYREVLNNHRKLLRRFGEQHDDALAVDLLRNKVEPRPFASAGKR